MDNRTQMVSEVTKELATLPSSELEKVAAYMHGVKDTIQYAQRMAVAQQAGKVEA